MSGFIAEDCELDHESALADFGTRLRETRSKQIEAIEAALPALERLVKVCAQMTGQSCKLRALLYSLWNGQKTSLLEVVTLDWSIKIDLLAVMLAFGVEPHEALPFFYNELSAAFKRAGLFEWFCEAHQEVAES